MKFIIKKQAYTFTLKGYVDAKTKVLGSFETSSFDVVNEICKALDNATRAANKPLNHANKGIVYWLEEE